MSMTTGTTSTTTTTSTMTSTTASSSSSTRQDTIDAGGGRSFAAYVSVPASPNGRAVIVLHEIFGVTPYITEVADRYAKEGYLAIAPDLFWRVEPGLALTHSRDDMKRAFGILENFSDKDALADISLAVDHARRQPGISSVAVIGMCLGGKLVFMAAGLLDVDAAIAFYGVGIEKHLADTPMPKAPLRMYFGAKDKYVTPEARDEIAAAMKGNAEVTMLVVDEADHAFYTRGDPAIIARTHAEALEFLDRHMARQGTAS